MLRAVLHGWFHIALALACFLVGWTGYSQAQTRLMPQAPGTQPVDTTPAASTKVEAGSPRESMQAFLRLTGHGDYESATFFLELPAGESSERGSELAERLKAVLDRSLSPSLEEVSPLATGNLDDGLPPDRDQAGAVKLRSGLSDPIRLVRRSDGRRTWWIFTASSVKRIDAWYDELGAAPLRDWIPEPLRRAGPFSIQWWQWLILLGLIPVMVLLGSILGRVVLAALHFVLRRTPGPWEVQLLPALRAPLYLLCMLSLAIPLTARLKLNTEVDGFIGALVKAGLTIGVFWTLMRLVGFLEDYLQHRRWLSESPELRSLVPLGARSTKVLLALLAIIATLGQLNYPVTTLLGALGIGGIAVALGAQKTLSNWIGSVAIAIDRPFHVGDWVKIQDVEGTVEGIGLRSTRVRTFDRTVVAIPNSSLSEIHTESYSARDRIRLSFRFGVVYETTAPQMRAIIQEIEAWLRQHPKVWQETVVVRFAALGDFALEIELQAWFLTTDMEEFRNLRQETLLAIMDIVERNASSFAFPTQTVYHADGGKWLHPLRPVPRD